MKITFVGLYRRDSYKNIILDSSYETIPPSFVELNSKYVFTQVKSFKFSVLHYNQIPVLTLDASNTEFRGYVVLNSSYQKSIRSFTFYLDSSYKKLNYSNFYFTGKYTSSSSNYIKFDSKYKKNSYIAYSYTTTYLAYNFVRIGLTCKYTFASIEKKDFKSITFINSYNNVKPIYFNVGGSSLECVFNIKANNGAGELLYGAIGFNVTNNLNIKGIDSGPYQLSLKWIVNIQGIDSPIGDIHIDTPQDIGGFLNYPSFFSAIKNPVGGFISNVLYFKVRRDIKEYKFYDASLSIPLIFKNVKLKNYLQPFVFVDVSVLKQSKMSDIFGFENKVNKEWYCLDLTVQDFINTKIDIFYHKIKPLFNNKMIYGFKTTKTGYGVAESNIFNLFVLPTKKSNYAIEDTALDNAFIQKIYFDRDFQVDTTINLPWESDSLKELKVYGKTYPLENSVIEPTKYFNLVNLNKMYVIYIEQTKINMLPIKYSINVCSTYNGNKLICNLHRHFYTSDSCEIMNTILTGYQELVDNMGGYFFRSDFSLSNDIIVDNTYGDFEFAITGLSQKIELLEVEENLGILLHIDINELNDIMLLEIPFHMSGFDDNSNVGGLIMECDLFIGLENLKNILFPLCEFKAV